jgi:hypothetical protein
MFVVPSLESRNKVAQLMMQHPNQRSSTRRIIEEQEAMEANTRIASVPCELANAESVC